MNRCCHSLAPETTLDLEEYVKNILIGLPSTTVVSICLLGRDYTSLLQELLLHHTGVDAWMLVSRFSSKTEPVVMLLPVDSISEVIWPCGLGFYICIVVLRSLSSEEDDEGNSGLSTLSEGKNSCEPWHCPWGFAVVDDVVPAFKTILEEKYSSAAVFHWEDTQRNRILWWKWRMKLDQRLKKLLRNIEDSWFGSWKYLLLREWLYHKKLAHDLRSKCKLDVNEGILKVILGASKNDCEGDTWISQLRFKKGCYIAKVGCCDEASRCLMSNATNGFGASSQLAFQKLNEAVNMFEVEQSRETIILVLDYDIQGKAGCRLTVEELAAAMKNHALFMYFDHGSGEQYISRQKIQELDKCAATLLMGCSSGSLILHGSYAPQGNSPFIPSGWFFSYSCQSMGGDRQ